MLTNDCSLIQLKDHILNNSLEIELISLTLSNSSEAMNGKGIICQDNTGRLILKFFSDNIFEESERIELLLETGKTLNSEGYIMPKSDYWSMSAVDNSQREYKCDRMYSHHPKDNYSIFYLSDKIFSDMSFTSTRILCIGKYEIPRSDNFHTSTNGSNFRFTDNHPYFEVELIPELTLRIIEYSSYVDIVLIHNMEIDHKIVLNTIQALNFVFGINLNIGFVSISDKELWIYPDPKRNQAKSIFSAPLSLGRSYSNFFFSNHKRLIKKYFEFICLDTKQQLPIIQQRIWSAGQSYPYIQAVVLSTQIESICKLYYSNYSKFDQYKFDLYTKAISIIDKSAELNKKEKNNVNEVLKNRLPKREQSPKEINPNQILKSLHQDNSISMKDFREEWNSLRNFTAHGDKLESNAKDNDKMIKGIYICTNLYYELVFKLIGYVGIYSYKGYDNNKLRVYFPHILADLGICDNEIIQCKEKSITIRDAKINEIAENDVAKNFRDWLDGVIFYTNCSPLSKVKYQEISLDEIIENKGSTHKLQS